ncbi:MAG: hypothetical protein OHK0048_24290 [Rhodoferax sp.]
MDPMVKMGPRFVELAPTTMRLNPSQCQQIHQTLTAVAGPSVSIWLFGSRLDDTVRGGDVDLWIQSQRPMDPLRRARVALRLEQPLELPVGIVWSLVGEPKTSFQQMVATTAQKLPAADFLDAADLPASGNGWLKPPVEHP